MHPLEKAIRTKWNTLNEDDNAIRVIGEVAMCYTGKSSAGYVYTRPSNRMVQFAWVKELTDTIDMDNDLIISTGTIPFNDFVRFNKMLEIS